MSCGVSTVLRSLVPRAGVSVQSFAAFLASKRRAPPLSPPPTALAWLTGLFSRAIFGAPPATEAGGARPHKRARES
jgi:hypothetical protein